MAPTKKHRKIYFKLFNAKISTIIIRHYTIFQYNRHELFGLPDNCIYIKNNNLFILKINNKNKIKKYCVILYIFVLTLDLKF